MPPKAAAKAAATTTVSAKNKNKNTKKKAAMAANSRPHVKGIKPKDFKRELNKQKKNFRNTVLRDAPNPKVKRARGMPRGTVKRASQLTLVKRKAKARATERLKQKKAAAKKQKKKAPPLHPPAAPKPARRRHLTVEEKNTVLRVYRYLKSQITLEEAEARIAEMFQRPFYKSYEDRWQIDIDAAAEVARKGVRLLKTTLPDEAIELIKKLGAERRLTSVRQTAGLLREVWDSHKLAGQAPPIAVVHAFFKECGLERDAPSHERDGDEVPLAAEEARHRDEMLWALGVFITAGFHPLPAKSPTTPPAEWVRDPEAWRRKFCDEPLSFPLDLIGNADETSLPMVTTITHFWCADGGRRAEIFSSMDPELKQLVANEANNVAAPPCSYDDRMNATGMFCVLANGEMLKPQIIFGGAPKGAGQAGMMFPASECTTLAQTVAQKVVPLASRSHWTTVETFTVLLDAVEKHRRDTCRTKYGGKALPFVLILDCASQHVSAAARAAFDKYEHIVPIFVPRTFTWALQPLDCVFFGPFKNYYKSRLANELATVVGSSAGGRVTYGLKHLRAAVVRTVAAVVSMPETKRWILSAFRSAHTVLEATYREVVDARTAVVRDAPVVETDEHGKQRMWFKTFPFAELAPKAVREMREKSAQWSQYERPHRRDILSSIVRDFVDPMAEFPAGSDADDDVPENANETAAWVTTQKRLVKGNALLRAKARALQQMRKEAVAKRNAARKRARHEARRPTAQTPAAQPPAETPPTRPHEPPTAVLVDDDDAAQPGPGHAGPPAGVLGDCPVPPPPRPVATRLEEHFEKR